MDAILQQPASRTLWTYLGLQERDRIRGLLDRAARYEEATLMNAAMWSPKELTRAEASFRASLRRHPDPQVEKARRDKAMQDSLSLIEQVSVLGGKK